MQTDRAASAALKKLYRTGVAPTAGGKAAARRPLIRKFSAPPPLKLSQGAAPADAATEPVLEIQEIQGNSLVGFNKDFQTFLFFSITDVTAAKRWVASLVPQVSTVAEVLAWQQLFRAMRARLSDEPIGLTGTWTNVAFSNRGIRLLCGQHQLDAFHDIAFKLGMDRQATALGDRTEGIGATIHPAGWVVGAGDTYADVLLIVAADREADLNRKVTGILREIETLQGAATDSADARGLRLIYTQQGRDLGGGLKGHEHFGFKDGISQPGVRGRTSDASEAFVTPRFIDPAEPLARTHSRPGQPLVWPGQFVFGDAYPKQSDDDAAQPGAAATPSPPWTRNGSYVVLRRLRQDVPRFWAFMHEQAQRLAQQPNFVGMTAIRLAALCVGRWPSGTPIMRSPSADDPAIAANDTAVNHFNFEGETAPLKLLPGATPDVFTPVAGDTAGIRCPFSAHIRKVNPRDQDPDDFPPAKRTLRRQMLRRGIPFGKPMRDPLNPVPDDTDRGLVFVSYQTSIDEQFEFLTTAWMNVDNRPLAYKEGLDRAMAGHDLIVGQTRTKPRRRSFVLRGPDGRYETIDAPDEFVTATGGGYFFSPSITALRDVLAAPIAPGPGSSPGGNA